MGTPTDRPRFAIMASGRGSNAEKLMDAFALLDADLTLVLSDKADAPVLAKAEERGYPTAAVPKGSSTRTAHERSVLEALAASECQHLLLAGYMRILSPWFLDRFEGKILNIHPSLLPDYPGLDAAARQWEDGVSMTGATVHFVDRGVDTGPILVQGSLTMRGDEGSEEFADRIRTEVEHRIYPVAVQLLLGQLEMERANRAAPGTIERALLSVSDKTGVVEFARRLSKLGIALFASGGTASTLEEAGILVTRVEELTGAAEVLEGRVKTLHPAVHAGILADRRNADHLDELAEHGYSTVDLVVCNLYPFRETLARGGSRDEVVDNIDIGGPTLVRAAAKNADGGVTVVVDPADYRRVLSWLEAHRAVPHAVRSDLAAKALGLIARYDGAIAEWAATEAPPPVGPFVRSVRLRYGENPHQQASLFVDETGRGVAAGILLQGRELSYNNLLDLDAAYRAAYGDGLPRCAIVKHTNPCGLAEAATQPEAFARALSGDPVAAFGSVLGFNQRVETATARAIIDSGLFVECIAAPGFSAEACTALGERSALRLVAVPPGNPHPGHDVRAIGGGVLVQQPDPGPALHPEWETVTEHQPDAVTRDEMAFAMRAVTLLKSNAICVTSERTLLGAGAGLMSRIDACRLALDKAGEHARGAVMASDAFFPFDDCVRAAAGAGISGIVQPGGSKRDDEVIAACNELGLAMVFTGRRHFRH